MKGKLTITIVIGLMCFVLVAIMFAQFKTIEKTDISSIESMRETELRTTLASWKTKHEEIQKKLNETYDKIDEYKQNGSNTQKSIKLLEKEIKEAEFLLGLTEVSGPGVVVTLEDNEEQDISTYDLLHLMNELKLAGAEAISINEIRVTNKTDVALISNAYIVVDGTRIHSPYTVKAIGNPVNLESGLMQKEAGYIDKVINAMDKTATVERQEGIIIPAYQGEITTKYINMEEQK